MKHVYLLAFLVGSALVVIPFGIGGAPVVYSAAPAAVALIATHPVPVDGVELVARAEALPDLLSEETSKADVAPVSLPSAASVSETEVPNVPFYSQFRDISSPAWQKVGCGIASIAMVIDYYSDEPITVDELLRQGIETGAYIESAGWSHAGLLALAARYSISGSSHDLRSLGETAAFSKLEAALKEGPVLASVHYTFDPNNPIPHLVVVNGVADGRVYFNDPAGKAGGESLTIAAFLRGWKERYISIEV